jgi:hypothetical protein
VDDWQTHCLFIKDFVHGLIDFGSGSFVSFSATVIQELENLVIFPLSYIVGGTGAKVGVVEVVRVAIVPVQPNMKA